MRERGPLGGARRRPSLVASNATQKLAGIPSNKKTSCRGGLRRGTTTSGPGRGPMAGFEVTLYGRICGDHRGIGFIANKRLHFSTAANRPMHSSNLVYVQNGGSGTINAPGSRDRREIDFAARLSGNHRRGGRKSASIRRQFWPFGNIMRSTSASDVTSDGPKSLFSKG
jgi:hypothetical protein